VVASRASAMAATNGPIPMNSIPPIRSDLYCHSCLLNPMTLDFSSLLDQLLYPTRPVPLASHCPARRRLRLGTSRVSCQIPSFNAILIFLCLQAASWRDCRGAVGCRSRCKKAPHNNLMAHQASLLSKI
jgi:hypothetical protein